MLEAIESVSCCGGKNFAYIGENTVWEANYYPTGGKNDLHSDTSDE